MRDFRKRQREGYRAIESSSSTRGTHEAHLVETADERYRSHRQQIARRKRVQPAAVEQVPRDDKVEEVQVAHMPLSPEETLISGVIRGLQMGRLSDAWPGLIPSRIGYHSTVDYAAKAIIRAHDSALQGRSSMISSSLRHYGEAMAGLRGSIARGDASEETLLAAALLVLFERDPWSPARVQLHEHLNGHLRGLSALLAATPPPTNGREVSEITRGVLYGHWVMTFLRPCALGIASPFDTPRWRSLEPASLARLPHALARVRKLSNVLFLRLPRLITLVRTARIHSVAVPETIAARALTDELLQQQDEAAENEFVLSLKIKKAHPLIAPLVPFSFSFGTIPRLEAGVYYWETQLMLLRLDWKLRNLHVSGETLPLPAEKQTPISRLCNNLLMCCEFGLTLGIVGRFAMTIALSAVWGSLQEFPDVLEPRLTAEKARWLLSRILGQPAIGWKPPNEADMDDIAGLLAGGPRQGWLCHLFQR